MTLMALGAMPVDHPLSLGMLGMHGARYCNLALDECDLLIAVGARFDDRATGKVAAFCPNAQIIHIDIDPAELDKIKTAHVGIAADVGEALAQLLPLLAENPRDRLAGAHRQAEGRVPAGACPTCDDPRSHFGLIRTIAACLDDEATIATDVGQHQMWVAQAYPLRRPRQWLTSGGLGTMGFGLPAAIGAALAEPQRTVVCFTGDGIDPDEHPGTRHRRRGERQRQDRADEQRHARPGAPAADAVLRRAPVRLEIQGHARFRPRRDGASALPRSTSTRRPIPAPR